MDISIYFEEAAQVSVAFVIGAIIGLEREFRSKPAGFRTMILICAGSCLYTILFPKPPSAAPTASPAISLPVSVFIGAGVIFKRRYFR